MSRHKTSGRHYATYSKPRKWFGTDFDRALAAFRQWEATREGEAVILHASAEELASVPDDPSLFYLQVRDGKFVSPQQIPAASFWRAVREAILADPHLAAQETGLPLDRLHKFKLAGPSLTLKRIGEDYLKKEPPLNPRYQKEAARYWREFRNSTKVKTVSELTADHFRRYRDAVYKKGKRHAPSWTNNRFTVVTSVLRYALTEGNDIENLQRAVTYSRMLRKKKKASTNPKPIKRKYFEQLLEAADTKWRAILLLSLNAAFYPVDAATVKKSDIDIRRKTLRNERTKTGVPRIAALWDRTIEAIQAYLKEEPHKSAYIFVADEGQPYTSKHLARVFREKVRAAAKVPDTVSFDMLRDGAQTAAIEGGAEEQHAEMLLGHRAGGTKDNYTKRKPSMVRDACQAIEKHYFGRTR